MFRFRRSRWFRSYHALASWWTFIWWWNSTWSPGFVLLFGYWSDYACMDYTAWKTVLKAWNREGRRKKVSWVLPSRYIIRILPWIYKHALRHTHCGDKVYRLKSILNPNSNQPLCEKNVSFLTHCTG